MRAFDHARRLDPTYRLVALLYLLGTATTATAASVLIPLADVPWQYVAVGSLVAAWGGIGSVAMRAMQAINLAHAQAQRGERITPPPPLMPMALLDVVVSAVIGAATWFFGAWQALDSSLVALLLLAAGFSGARLALRASDTFNDGAVAALRRLLNLPPS